MFYNIILVLWQKFRHYILRTSKLNYLLPKTIIIYKIIFKVYYQFLYLIRNLC